jgi:hypothetical protein
MTEGSVLDRSLTARPTVSRKLPGEELAENPALFKSRVVELVNTAGFEPAALGLYVRVVPLLPHPTSQPRNRGAFLRLEILHEIKAKQEANAR